MHKLRVVLSTSALVAGMGLIAAPSVQAAASPSVIYIMPADATVACNNAGNAVSIRDSDTRTGGAPSGNIVTTITGVSTDSVLIENKCSGGSLPALNGMTVAWLGTSGGVTNGSSLVPRNGSYNLPIGTVTSLTFTDAASLMRATITVTSGGGGGGSGGSSFDSASSSAPTPIVQQFGKPAAGMCDAAAPVTLNWGGAGSGGWGESWAQWMNNSKGGAVCTRTLVYSSSRGAWTVG